MLKVGIGTALGLLLLGVALVVLGVALIFPPAALILAGAAVIAFVLDRVDVQPGRGRRR